MNNAYVLLEALCMPLRGTILFFSATETPVNSGKWTWDIFAMGCPGGLARCTTLDVIRNSGNGFEFIFQTHYLVLAKGAPPFFLAV
jgi:hypothetical protein